MTEIKSKLTKKEQIFCSCFADTGDCEMSAKSAGYSKNPEQAAESLLSREDIFEEIRRLSVLRGKFLEGAAVTGYRRLAFGSIADAVKLLFMDKPTSAELEEMDLFSVSEIKRPKEGTMEIKFFDRLKALEKLEGRGSDKSGAKSLFDAISESARAVGSDEIGN